MLIILLTAFILSSGALLLLYPLSIRLGFVDSPSERKHHNGDIPLIGGLSIYISLSLLFLLFPTLIPDSAAYLICSSILVLIGFVDDKFDISVTSRMLILISLSIWLFYTAGFGIYDLGDLFGYGNVNLNGFSLVFTIAAIIGSITAFNMVDGLDGLLGGLACTTFSGMALLFWHENQYNLMLYCLVFIVAMAPYLLFNLAPLPNNKHKIFMGDSGSLFIGFSVIWLLIEGSQEVNNATSKVIIHPVTALWLIAIPLMDMAATMIRRIRKRQSPFKADREHIHHIFQRIGFSPLQTLLIICSSSLCLMLIGVAGELYGVSEAKMFIGFLCLFGLYFYCFNHIWKITSFVRSIFHRLHGA